MEKETKSLQAKLIGYFNHFLFLRRNWELHQEWKKCKEGKTAFAIRKTCGYFSTDKNRLHHIPMKSGLTALTYCIDHSNFRDPSDMVDWALFKTVGYEECGLFADMTFPELVEFFETKKLGIETEKEKKERLSFQLIS